MNDLLTATLTTCNSDQQHHSTPRKCSIAWYSSRTSTSYQQQNPHFHTDFKNITRNAFFFLL